MLADGILNKILLCGQTWKNITLCFESNGFLSR